jgi:Transcriptional regulator, AbiEi antitoxin, Type IV TA system/Transcriptional regulator, AbiEi antitoxin N-terminal domain
MPTAWLQERGFNAKQVARLAQDGWLTRLGHGVYILPGDQLNRDASIARLAESMPGLHVAGKTALAWRGVRHNLAVKEQLILWGDRASTLPTWFTSAFPADYQATHLFDPGLDAHAGVAPLPGGRPDVPVSTPERALLELLSDVGKGQELEEARHLVESARTLRPVVLDELLSHLKRIKVARLAHALAEELELSWVDLARKHSERLGGGSRWVSTTRSGERLNLKRPT